MVRITSIRTSSALIDVVAVITESRSYAIIAGVTGATRVTGAAIDVRAGSTRTFVPRSAGTCEGRGSVQAGCVFIAVVRFGSALVYIDAVITEGRSFAIFAGVAGITSNPFAAIDVFARVDAEIKARVADAIVIAVFVYAMGVEFELAYREIFALIDVDLASVTFPAGFGTITSEARVRRVDVRTTTAVQARVGVAGIDVGLTAVTFVTSTRAVAAVDAIVADAGVAVDDCGSVALVGPHIAGFRSVAPQVIIAMTVIRTLHASEASDGIDASRCRTVPFTVVLITHAFINVFTATITVGLMTTYASAVKTTLFIYTLEVEIEPTVVGSEFALVDVDAGVTVRLVTVVTNTGIRAIAVDTVGVGSSVADREIFALVDVILATITGETGSVAVAGIGE